MSRDGVEAATARPLVVGERNPGGPVGGGSREIGASLIEKAFWEFHAANPHVYDRLVHLARGLKARGDRKVGIGSLFEVLRWHHLMTTTGDADGFRLNNNYRSYYARLIMAREPDLDGVFELRRLHAGDEPFDQHPVAEPVGHVAPPRVELPDPDTFRRRARTAGVPVRRLGGDVKFRRRTLPPAIKNERNHMDTVDLTTAYIERRAKFKKRAESNLNRALHAFKQLERCANTNIYSYDENQKATLVAELRRGVDEVERAFQMDRGVGRRWVEL